MRFDVISVFPGLVRSIGEFGVCGRAIDRGLVTVKAWDLRDFTHDVHRTVDDRPFGGGPGMVMKPEPLRAALRAAREAAQAPATAVYLSPQGRRLDQGLVTELASEDRLILLAGRYEGVDERVIDAEIDIEVSIGDYVLSGGELPALVLMDALIRQQPGVLGHADSAQQDSFADGLLDCPHYTRPEVFTEAGEEHRVPSVLMSGDHAAIRRWRLKQALGRTWLRRPDLLEQRVLTDEEASLLEAFRQETFGTFETKN